MQSISMNDFADRWTPQATVVDVRETSEYVAGHVPDSLLIPLGELPGRTHEVTADGPVYVICRSGNRSKAGTNILAAAGFDAYNVEEGMLGWASRGRDIATGMPVR